FLRGEHVRARAERGLLNDVAAEYAAAERERNELLALLRSLGFLRDRVSDDSGGGNAVQPSETEIVLAMPRLLAATPCQLKLISPYDVLAEPRQPNLP